MSGRLDWKWIGLGVAIMFGLNLVAGLVLALLWSDAVPAGDEIDSIETALTSGQVILAAALSFLTFAVGGYIVAVRSSGRTILEPGISAAIAVALGLLIAGGFSLVNLLAGALVPFLAGLLGGWIGERRTA